MCTVSGLQTQQWCALPSDTASSGPGLSVTIQVLCIQNACHGSSFPEGERDEAGERGTGPKCDPMKAIAICKCSRDQLPCSSYHDQCCDRRLRVLLQPCYPDTTCWACRVGKQIVNVPSFLVRVDSQKHIDFALNSPFGGGRPGRVKRKHQKYVLTVNEFPVVDKASLASMSTSCSDQHALLALHQWDPVGFALISAQLAPTAFIETVVIGNGMPENWASIFCKPWSALARASSARMADGDGFVFH